MTTTIFNCKTIEAFHIKILAELLTNTLKNGCFEISKDEIVLKQFDNPRKALVHLVLYGKNFDVYSFSQEKIYFLGLNLNHFHKTLKSIKKKDSLQLFIDAKDSIQLGIKTIPKEKTRVSTSKIKIQNTQNLDIELPEGYNSPINVTSSDFQKMCKELNSVGSSTIKVVAKKFFIEFIADADGILNRKIEFGDFEESIKYDDSNTYEGTFSTDQLTRISKISGLSNRMQIYAAKNLPLLFKSNIGSLGVISLYIKSKEISEEEMSEGENDDEDDE
jgi:proliferating cell nuclear antigen PCNA